MQQSKQILDRLHESLLSGTGATRGPTRGAPRGPSRAQVGGPKPGPSWAQARNLGPKQIQKTKILKIKIRSAQNVGKVFYAGKKASPPHLPPPGPFFAWARKIQRLHKFCLFSLVGPWALFTRFGALAAIHPRWGNRYILVED